MIEGFQILKIILLRPLISSMTEPQATNTIQKILLAGLLMALTYIGGELAQLMLGVPGASIQLFQGMLLFFLLATDVFTNYRVRIGREEAV